MTFSIFPTAKTDRPSGTTTLENFIKDIQAGTWQKTVELLRSKRGTPAFKKMKSGLPAVTISGQFKTRDKKIPLAKKLAHHTGFICIDIDKKDNPKLRTRDLIDKDCTAQFVSCSGEGVKVIYKCTPVSTMEEHRRIFDAVVERLAKLKIQINVDPIVKSIASLQYISYDPEPFYKPNTKLVIKPLPPIKKKKAQPLTGDLEQELAKLNEFIDALGNKDVTAEYEDWVTIMFGVAHTFGETGRAAVHRISANYPGYNKNDTDEKFDGCIGSPYSGNPVTIASVYQIIMDNAPKIKIRQLVKKYNGHHAVGEGVEHEKEQGDLAGLVRYKLFLFKKIIDKKENVILDLVPQEINMLAFGDLLTIQGFYKFEKRYVRVVENVVEEVTIHEIIRLITAFIKYDGDYNFSYKGVTYNMSWEELSYTWYKARASSTMHNQVASSVMTWIPNLLKDSADTSYLPYRNGVLKLSCKTRELVPYHRMTMQIWKEHILPRDFVYDKQPGMFEEFFINVMGRGDNRKLRRQSKQYWDSLWAYGYMLQGFKRQSKARAWLLYDVKHGNSGRTGKTIIGQAVSKLRNVLTIDGKRFDLKYQFAFDAIEPWTQVVFIDDPDKRLSLNPMFNMISGNMNAEKKGGRTLVVSVKIMIASNNILEAKDSSEIGRQFVTQLDDYYTRYAKEHNNTITPIIDLHGKEFFTDWDDKDWRQFDTFSAFALQHHLGNNAPENIITGNSQLLRFKQQHEEDLFYTLCSLFKTSLVKLKDGYAVPQTAMITEIKEAHNHLTSIGAGKIAREFLSVIGIKNPTVTAYVQAGRTFMVWKIDKNPLEIDFGGAKNLPAFSASLGLKKA